MITSSVCVVVSLLLCRHHLLSSSFILRVIFCHRVIISPLPLLFVNVSSLLCRHSPRFYFCRRHCPCHRSFCAVVDHPLCLSSQNRCSLISSASNNLPGLLQISYVFLVRLSEGHIYTILNNIHEGGHFGSRNRKRDSASGLS